MAAAIKESGAVWLAAKNPKFPRCAFLKGHFICVHPVTKDGFNESYGGTVEAYTIS